MDFADAGFLREEFADAVDTQLERAIDALVAARIFGANRDVK